MLESELHNKESEGDGTGATSSSGIAEASASDVGAPPGDAGGTPVMSAGGRPDGDGAQAGGEGGQGPRQRRTTTRRRTTRATSTSAAVDGGPEAPPATEDSASDRRRDSQDATGAQSPAAQAVDAGPPVVRFMSRDSAAAPAADAASQAAPQSPAAPSAVPAATFQPPQVIFQPPAETSRAAATSGTVSNSTTSGTASRGTASSSTASRGTASSGATVSGGTASAGPANGGTEAEHEESEGEGAGRRRRRRGSRSRGRADGEGAAEADSAESGAEAHANGPVRAAGAEPSEQAESADDDADDDGETGTAGSRRRRRKRRRGAAADTDQRSPDDPPDTVVHVRAVRSGSDDPSGEVQSVRGSTRLEAKRQRRREGRDTGRRRPPIITESEFLARREAVERVMVVRQSGERTQIGVLEDGVLVEHYVDRATHKSLVGNVYLGKVQNVLPSMEAAFVDIGKGRNAVLYAGEVNFDASGLEGESKRIESALKSGQSVLVQVTKDPVGHKGARLTSQVSLPGRYLVYVPGGSMMGISRKLADTERTRLKQILKQVMPEEAGVIVRTAAEGASEEELAHDVARLAAQWEAIEAKARSASPPELLYSEPDLTIRVVRDIFNEDFSRLVISGEQGWDLVDEYVRYVAPHLVERLERFDEDEDAFARYRIDEQLAKALERKVWLPSGGSLVIDTTEAMTVIDVNTGKFTGQGGNLEETVTRNNLEAAEEIVRQLRLRDVGGIIVIDFIDMVLESNRELVLRRLLECLARDRTKHQVAEVTSLGLVQMTRKRVGSGLLEAFSQPCECCNGRGLIVSLDGPYAATGERSRAGGRPARANGSHPQDAPQNGGNGSSSPAQSSSRSRSRRSGRGQAAGQDQPEQPLATEEPLAAEAGMTDQAGAGEAVDAETAVAEVRAADAGAEESAITLDRADTRATASGLDNSGFHDQPSDEDAAPASGGRRRRRSATREPGPPDNPDSTTGIVNVAEPGAPTSAAAGV
ncbi:MAG TPA: Rne/Rng family ribonuclease [Streptosporangiaceae bacterium]|nr:Rne/Rng family ribonuclease [Streptosporangiaceae bacterium]